MKARLNIISDALLDGYKQNVSESLQERFEALRDAEISTADFDFCTSVAAVFSSKIEGEEIELDSYVKHKRFGVEFQPDYTKKIDDLYNAFLFAQQSALNRENLEKAHAILTKNILAEYQQGVLRKQNMYVTTPDGKIEYVAASPFELETEMQKFYSDLETLLSAPLNLKEAFFFAAMLHLVFVKIHPFNDGNGRTARLLEKWFLAKKAGDKAWYVQSEKHDYEQHKTYYNNLRALGVEYEKLDYSGAMPFLLMLSQSLE